MKLQGEKILIRDLSFKDKDAYYEFGKNPNVGPQAGWKPFPNKGVADRMLTSLILSKETYAIALKENNILIGTISIYESSIRKYNKVKSIGFSLAYEYWNQGIMTEALNLIVSFIFKKLDCQLIEIGHHSDNIASKRVIEKCGFSYDGRLCKYKRLYDGRIIDADFYSLTIEEFERKMNNE